MATITIASHKGGVGKSTLGYHLSGALATIEQAPVLLVDGDQNRSVLNWFRRGKKRNLGFEVVGAASAPGWVVKNGAPKHMIKDTQARPTPEQMEDIVESSDVILIPTTPDALAMDVLSGFLADLQTACKTVGTDVPYAFVLTIIDTRTKDGREAKTFLEEQGQPLFNNWMRLYNAYRKAADQGCLVKDARTDSGKKDDNAGVAWMDCMSIARELLADLEVSNA